VNAARPEALPWPVAAPIHVLDRARLLWLRLLGPLATPLVRSRELRVATFGTIAILVALASSALFPIWMLALGPILLGVPHVAADVRYLVTRPGLHRRWPFWALVAVPLAILVFTIDARWGFAAMIGASIASRGSVVSRVLFAIAGAVAIGIATGEPFVAALVVAHLHNFAAMGIWLAWRKRRSWMFLFPVTAFALGCAAILGGAIDPVLLAVRAWESSAGGTDLWYHLSALAPGFEAPWGPRLVVLFAFAQSVHYAIWIRLVPEEDRGRETPRTWAATLAAWREDSGSWLVGAFVLAAVALAAWALVDLAAAREGYLRGVLFHGYLEFAVIAWLVSEGRGIRHETREAAEAPA
jgi:hypothetical protein